MELQNLPDGDLDAGPDARFKCWLLLANLGKGTRAVLGFGVVSASLRRQGTMVMHVVCMRADGTQVTVELSMHPWQRILGAGVPRKQWCCRA